VIIRKHSDGYNFVGNPETGITFRWGKTTKEDPKIAPWPELADISISNYCSKQCNFCYRNSGPSGDFMSIKDYGFVLDNLSDKKWGKVFQVALGGGEPTEHPDFIKILEITRKKGIFQTIPQMVKLFPMKCLKRLRNFAAPLRYPLTIVRLVKEN